MPKQEKSRSLLLAGLTIACFLPVQAAPIPPNSPRWQLQADGKTGEYAGRPCLALQDGAAILKDFEMTDGVIDVDVAGNGERAFYDIFFRIQPDGDRETVYLRPHKSGLDDAQQYTPILNGAAVWQIYNGPGFTGAVDVPKDAWFHVRLEITGAQAKLYVNDMQKPSLVIDDLKSGFRKGGVGLEGACFSNFEVRETPAAPWQRHEPAMPPAVITKWSLSPEFDALSRDLEAALSKSDEASMKWDDVTAEPPGFVVINRYRESPEIIPTFTRDFSKRLDPQKGMKVVYARTAIASDRDQIKKLNIGYSDDVSVFLNGQILYRGRSAQRFRDPGFLGIVNAENDAVYLPLKKGRNVLLLAVSELTGGWAFICRFDNMDGLGASFDVATIKLVKPEDSNAGRYIRMQSAHQFLVKNTTVSGMIAAAFDLNQNMVLGGPKWVTDDRYDIVAVTPGEERPTVDDQMGMLRRLLTGRFKLTYHMEKKPGPLYILSVAKGGPKLDPAKSPADPSPALISTLVPAATGGIDHVLLPGRNVTVRQLASTLRRAVLDRPVVDDTGIDGNYDFDLEWTPDDGQFGGTLPLAASNSGKPGLYTAIEQQLGLKLTSTRGDVETLVIDGLDRPSEN